MLKGTLPTAGEVRSIVQKRSNATVFSTQVGFTTKRSRIPFSEVEVFQTVGVDYANDNGISFDEVRFAGSVFLAGADRETPLKVSLFINFHFHKLSFLTEIYFVS